MKSLSISPSIVALSLVLVFMTSALPVSAIDRVSGQSWTYAVSMPVSGLNATGTVTYALTGQDSVKVNGVSYDTDILTISGNLSASSTVFGAPYSVSAVLGGSRYETKGGISTVKEDSLQWTNVSFGSVPVQLFARIQKEAITTYAPAFLSKFDPGTTRPGDTWTEAITLNTTSILNGTTVRGIPHLAIYNVIVGSSMENITVDAGTFQTLKITTTDSTGARNVYWWSSKVQNFVVEKRYNALSSQPSTILSLKEFVSSAGDGTLIAVVVGAVVVAIAIAILAAILKARRKWEPVNPPPYRVGVPGPNQMPPPAPPGVKTPGRIRKHPKN